jgi:hypothetical protein
MRIACDAFQREIDNGCVDLGEEHAKRRRKQHISLRRSFWRMLSS